MFPGKFEILGVLSLKQRKAKIGENSGKLKTFTCNKVTWSAYTCRKLSVVFTRHFQNLKTILCVFK